MIERKAGELTTYDTRAEAHESVNKAKRYKEIIDVLQGKELTAKEIAYLLYHKKLILTPERNYTAPRLTELMQKGVVEPIGKKKCAWTGKTVAVYRLREQQATIFN
jgi:hypothetical protein